MPAVALVVVLLVFPIYALSQLAAWRFLALAGAAASVVTFFAYRRDKRCAEAGEWRIPEATLHLAELLGGWPGAFLAQRIFRHKTSKVSYQVMFWVIVLVHQFVAVDFLMDWRLAKELLHFVQSQRR
jgi:uncharacterized membrane protein YsdA (DUF1294 family)